jgi:hypothetical protein
MTGAASDLCFTPSIWRFPQRESVTQAGVDGDLLERSLQRDRDDVRTGGLVAVQAEPGETRPRRPRRGRPPMATRTQRALPGVTRGARSPGRADRRYAGQAVIEVSCTRSGRCGSALGSRGTPTDPRQCRATLGEATERSHSVSEAGSLPPPRAVRVRARNLLTSVMGAISRTGGRSGNFNRGTRWEDAWPPNTEDGGYSLLQPRVRPIDWIRMCRHCVCLTYASTSEGPSNARIFDGAAAHNRA